MAVAGVDSQAPEHVQCPHKRVRAPFECSSITSCPITHSNNKCIWPCGNSWAGSTQALHSKFGNKI